MTSDELGDRLRGKTLLTPQDCPPGRKLLVVGGQYQHNQGEGFCKWFHAEAVGTPPGEEEAKADDGPVATSVADFCRRAFREEGFLAGVARCNASGAPLAGVGAAGRDSGEALDSATDKAFEALSVFSMARESVAKYRGHELSRWGGGGGQAWDADETPP